MQAGFVYADEHGYEYMAQVDGDGQHDAAELRQLYDAMRRLRRRHGLRLALPVGRPALPGADQPPHRHPRLRVPALAPRRRAGHRPDVGLPPLQPARDRPLRARLPARLPRGRGGADAAPPPPDDARDPGAHVPARRRRRPRSARASRPTTWSRSCWRCSSASPAGAPWSNPATTRPSPPARGSDGPAPARLPARRGRPADRRARARAAPATARALRAAVAVRAPS